MTVEALHLQPSPSGDWPDLEPAADVAARHLGAGGLLGHPTHGVYGLGGRRSTRCESTIAHLKGRPADKGLLYLVASAEVARTEFPEAVWSPVASRLAARFWPGPLTIILPDGTTNGIAVRAESHPVTRAVLERWGGSMSSTSLNRAGEAPVRTESEAMNAAAALPETDLPILILCAGDLGSSPPSTLVRPTSDSFEVLRPGSVSTTDLEAALS